MFSFIIQYARLFALSKNRCILAIFRSVDKIEQNLKQRTFSLFLSPWRMVLEPYLDPLGN